MAASTCPGGGALRPAGSGPICNLIHVQVFDVDPRLLADWTPCKASQAQRRVRPAARVCRSSNPSTTYPGSPWRGLGADTKAPADRSLDAAISPPIYIQTGECSRTLNAFGLNFEGVNSVGLAPGGLIDTDYSDLPFYRRKQRKFVLRNESAYREDVAYGGHFRGLVGCGGWPPRAGRRGGLADGRRRLPGKARIFGR